LGALLVFPLDFPLDLALEEPAVVAVDPAAAEPEALAVALAALGWGRASRNVNNPVAPAAATTSQRVIRETRLRWRSRWRGVVFTPSLSTPKLRVP